jgi:Glycosyltransferase family 10 (fucosyltransferase) C-term
MFTPLKVDMKLKKYCRNSLPTLIFIQICLVIPDGKWRRLREIQDPKVYTCGYEYGSLAKTWFPGSQITRLEENVNPKLEDILIYGKFGPCMNLRYETFIDWLGKNWKGKCLVINGEGSKGSSIIKNTFQIGMSPDSNSSVYVVYVSLVLLFLLPQHNRRKIFHHRDKPKNTGKFFCAYAASNCLKFRDDASKLLSRQVSIVTKLGKCPRKNKLLTSKVSTNFSSSWEMNDVVFRDYRFCLVMENENAQGYVTEKILMAFLAGCIPIYYGTDDIFNIFNPKSFIYYNISNPKETINRIRELETNKSLYLSILNDEKILRKDIETIRDYFSLKDTVEKGYLKKKILESLFDRH